MFFSLVECNTLSLSSLRVISPWTKILLLLLLFLSPDDGLESVLDDSLNLLGGEGTGIKSIPSDFNIFN